MNLLTLTGAVPALKKIASVSIPFRSALALKRKIDAIEEYLEFYREQMRIICKKYEGKNVSDPGYQRELAELNDFDVDIGDALSIIPPDDLSMSYNELCSIEGIIEIKFDESEVANE